MSSSPEKCAIDGDDNLYGLGVRLGQYFLWFALVAVYLHKQSKMRAIMINLIIFQLALTVAMIWKVIASDEQIFNIDIVVATSFTVLQTFLLTIPLYNPVPGRHPVHGFIFIFMFLVIGLASAFNFWFWFVEIDNMAEPPCDAIITFFFKKVSLNGWFRTFAKVLSAIILGLSSLVLLMFLFLILCCRRRIGLRDVLNQFGKRDSEEDEDTVLQKYPRLLKIVFWIIIIPTLVGMISNTELLIKWNHIQNVNTLESTGQTIPFIVGLVSFLDVVVDLLIPKNPKRPCSDEVTEVDMTSISDRSG